MKLGVCGKTPQPLRGWGNFFSFLPQVSPGAIHIQPLSGLGSYVIFLYFTQSGNAIKGNSDHFKFQVAPKFAYLASPTFVRFANPLYYFVENVFNPLNDSPFSRTPMPSQTKTITEVFRTLREFVDTLQIQIEAVEKRTGHLEQQQAQFEPLKSIGERINGQQKRFKVLENWNNRLEEQQKSAIQILKELIDSQKQASTRLAEAEEFFDSLQIQKTRLGLIENSVEKLEQLKTYVKVIDQLSDNLKQHQKHLKKLENQIHQIELAQTRLEDSKTLEKHQIRLEIIENRTEHLEQAHFFDCLDEDNPKSLQTQIKTLETHTDDQLEQIQTRLTGLEKLTPDLEQQICQSIISFNNEFERLQTHYAAIEQRIEKGIETPQTQQIQLDHIKEQLENIELIQISELVSRLAYLERALLHISDLETQINDAEQRTREFAKLLPLAIREASQSINAQTPSEVSELTDSLQKPVEYCIRQSISKDTQPFAEALFPVMGPAIRKSINESFKTLIQSINQGLEQSLSLQGLGWRIKAWRSGRPFAEIVLQQTLIYRIDQVFLIHRETGLLIQHLHQDTVKINDSDAVSAMLTAIQDFIRDSFSASKTEELDSVEIGEYTVWMERGPYAVLACVIRGIAPYQFRNLMRSTLETLHGRYGALLQQYSGDNLLLQPSRPLLEETLQMETKSDRQSQRLSYRLVVIVSVILLTLIGWGYYHFQHQQRLTDYIEALRKAPGIVVTSFKRSGGRWVIEGLRDPLAADPLQIQLQHHLSENEIESHWTPYLDLTPQLIEQRLERQLQPPATVSIQVQGDVLYLTGYASPNWINQIKSISQINQITYAVMGINRIDLSQLVDTEHYLLQQARLKLAPPDTVTLTMQGRTLRVTGLVDATTYQTLLERIELLPISELAYADVETASLILRENVEQQRDNLIQQIEKKPFYFTDGAIDLLPGQQSKLESLYQQVQQILTLSQALHQSVRLQIIGSTDGRGDRKRNEQLAQQRAEWVQNWLISVGIAKDILTITPPERIRFGENESNPSYRKVNFRVAIFNLVNG